MSSRSIKVVVVGVASAGMKAAKAVAALATQGYPNLSVTTIDKRDSYFHALGAPRTLVNQEFGKQLLFPLNNFLDRYNPPNHKNHQFIHASLTSVNGDQTVELSTGQVLPYDYLVLATGSRNQVPAHFEGNTAEEIQAHMEEVFANVRAAKNILIIGGGAVGVEMAGEIADAYPEKKVTLVHSGNRLLPLRFKESIGQGAMDKLKRLGVNVVLDEKVNIPPGIPFDCKIRQLTLRGSSGTEYSSDLQIFSIGTTLHTEYMQPLETHLGVSLRDSRGAIKVKPTLQIDSPGLLNVFVPGDVNDLSLGTKFFLKAKEQGITVGDNLVRMIKYGYDMENSPKQPKLVNYTGGEMRLFLVPIGKTLGVTQLHDLALGRSALGNILVRNIKSKDYFVGKVATEFPAPK
ncbi:hypothetical protein GGI07_003759 [Coemansia sp. Benny D115]|nr:hypothetical protein GGI07_003759 [Coemansia sp. Benny D115]